MRSKADNKKLKEQLLEELLEQTCKGLIKTYGLTLIKKLVVLDTEWLHLVFHATQLYFQQKYAFSLFR